MTNLRIATTDASLRHLEHKLTGVSGQETGLSTAATASPPSPAARQLIWTPRATKMVQESGLDPAAITDIEATGPGGRVSGDDVARYLAKIGKK